MNFLRNHQIDIQTCIPSLLSHLQGRGVPMLQILSTMFCYLSFRFRQFESYKIVCHHHFISISMITKEMEYFCLLSV